MYFQNTNVKDTSKSKKFWKTINPFFINTDLNTNKLVLIEKTNLIMKESVLANTMKKYFTSITKQLNLKKIFQDIINY